MQTDEKNPAGKIVGSSDVLGAEVLWLLEVSDQGIHGGRGFWNGSSFGWDATKAVRFPTKDGAEKCAEKIFGDFLWWLPGKRVEICEHIFNCRST